MQMIGCGPNAITNVRKSIDLTGSPPPQAKIGRPTKKSPEVKAFVKQKTINEPYISGEDRKTQIQQSMNISIGSSTVNYIRSDQGFKFLLPLHQPNLTDLQIQKRLNFCYTILIHRHELPYISFSDESRFALGGDKRWLWRMRKNFNPNTVVPQIKFPPSLMIWGMVSMNYKSSLFIFNENENSKNYTEMLNEKFFILDALTYFENDFAFQQDGAPSHTANYTMENLQKLCDLIVNWPPNSPDLINLILIYFQLIYKIKQEILLQNYKLTIQLKYQIK